MSEIPKKSSGTKRRLVAKPVKKSRRKVIEIETPSLEQPQYFPSDNSDTKLIDITPQEFYDLVKLEEKGKEIQLINWDSLVNDHAYKQNFLTAHRMLHFYRYAKQSKQFFTSNMNKFINSFAKLTFYEYASNTYQISKYNNFILINTNYILHNTSFEIIGKEDEDSGSLIPLDKRDLMLIQSKHWKYKEYEHDDNIENEILCDEIDQFKNMAIKYQLNNKK